jgi:RNA polymerase sigma factor (sigma-70 family)
MIPDAPALQSYQSLRPYLFSVAYRMTGSASDAEDLVQDAWIRYIDAGEPVVESLRAYLTTIVSRLSLDYLKSARVKREQYIGTWLPEPVLTADVISGPEASVEERESVSLALLTVLEHLTPGQRVVYVLREGFALPYEEIATHLGKTPTTCRQIFRRAQRRISEAEPRRSVPPGADETLLMRFMDAFARGDTAGVAALLAEDAVWVADGGPQRLSNRKGVVGRDKVSRGLAGLGRKRRPGLDLSVRIEHINGTPAVLLLNHGKIERVIILDAEDGQITDIRIVLNPEKLAHLAASLGTEPAWVSPFPVPRRAVTETAASGDAAG